MEQVLEFERRKHKADIKKFTESIDELMHSILCYTRETANVGDLAFPFSCFGYVTID